VLKKSKHHSIAEDEVKSLSARPKANVAAHKAVVESARVNVDALAAKAKPAPAKLDTVKAKPEATEKPTVVAAIKPLPAELQKNPLATVASPIDPKMAAKDSAAPGVVVKPKALPAPVEKSSNSRYTLQLVSFTQQALVDSFMRKYSAMGSNLRTIKINKDGNEKYLVVYGSFDSTVQANAAKQKLPPELSQAWARKM
jgi:DamX protein